MKGEKILSVKGILLKKINENGISNSVSSEAEFKEFEPFAQIYDAFQTWNCI